MSKAVVPGIPMSALNYVKDENVKHVLTALIDGWQMRNDQTGDGGNKFLTQADLDASVTKMIDGGRLAAGSGSAGTWDTPPPGYISGLIANLQASIVESKLWKDLGQRIDLIDIKGARNTAGVLTETENRVNADNALVTTTTTQFATINNNVAAVQTSVTTMANSYAALSTQVNTVQASINGVSASVQQESTARANADGSLYAQYTVKVDNNGYVSGFGLASTVNNATALSEFYVRADRFAIGSPTVPRQYVWGQLLPAPAANMPFIVRTNNWVDSNGVTQPGGVFMKGVWIEYAAIDTAHIRNASIDTAKIKDLSVSTLKIAGQAVTIPVSAFAQASSVSATITIDANYPIFVIGSLTQSAFSTITLQRNGVTLWSEAPVGATLATRGITDSPGPGTHTYTLSSTSPLNTNGTSLFLLATKR